MERGGMEGVRWKVWYGREEEWMGWDGECGMLPNSKVW